MTVDMDMLKKMVAEYVQLKQDLKTITERKKLLEKTICSNMDQMDVSVLEMPDGTKLNYSVKEAITVSKEKAKKQKE